MTTATTMTTILWPLHRTICVSRHPQLRSRGFCWSKVLLRTCCCWHLAHLDARVLLNGVTYTVCVPWAAIITTIVIIWQLIWHSNMSELLQTSEWWCCGWEGNCSSGHCSQHFIGFMTNITASEPYTCVNNVSLYSISLCLNQNVRQCPTWWSLCRI